MEIKKTFAYRKFRKLVKKSYDLKNRLNERKYISDDGVVLKHLFIHNNRSDVLIIGFSGCFEGGAIYNYVGSCSDFKVNKLFIKDDFAENHRGCYYIGSNSKYNVEQAVIQLINRIRKKTNSKKLIFIGTSKGAYASINFALHYPGSYVVCGAPQYYVADYLMANSFDVNLEEILGKENINPESIEALNLRLKNKIVSNTKLSQIINIMYSDKEHTYEEHIKDMLSDFHNSGYTVIEKVEKFPEHGDVGKHFPQYLKNRLTEII